MMRWVARGNVKYFRWSCGSWCVLATQVRSGWTVGIAIGSRSVTITWAKD